MKNSILKNIPTSTTTPKRLLVMAGGTGGHVFPALAMAKRFQEEGYEIHWLGSNTGFEYNVVQAAGFCFHHCQVSGLRGKGMLSFVKAPFMLLKAFWQAFCVIRELKPRLVMGMGGYVTGPGGLAARLLNRPLVIHEQNAVAGTTNKILKKIASHVFVAFAGAFDKRDAKGNTQVIPRDERISVVGNPVRKELMHLAPPSARYTQRRGPLQILVVGGSLGAAAINQVMPEAMQLYKTMGAAPKIWHQVGKNQSKAVMEQYKSLGIEAFVEPFIEDMASAYAWADLVICRAGALTVSELAAVGVASILIPLPHAIDNHQFFNAKWLASSEAAVILEQKDLNPKRLCELIVKLVEGEQHQKENKQSDEKEHPISRELLMSMANFGYELAERDAVDKILFKCFEVCGAN